MHAIYTKSKIFEGYKYIYINIIGIQLYIYTLLHTKIPVRI